MPVSAGVRVIKMDKGKKKTPIVISAVLLAVFVLIFAGAFIYLHAANSDKTLIVYFTRVGNTDFSDDVDAVSSASLRRGLDGIVLVQSDEKSDCAIRTQ